MKRFNVVIPKEDGGVELYPMKAWLRQHPDRFPGGLDATTSTSHELRNGLKKMGWSVQDLDSEVRLILPGAANVEPTVGTVLDRKDPRPHIAGELTRCSARGIVDVAIEDVGDVDKGRILRLRTDLGRTHTIIEYAKPCANGGLAVAEYVVSDTDARAPVIPVGGVPAARHTPEQALKSRWLLADRVGRPPAPFLEVRAGRAAIIRFS